MIDWNRVSDLRSEIGAEDFDEIVDIFLDEVEQTIDRLRTHASGDTPDASFADGEAEGIMHFLKGSALNLGFDTFARICQEEEGRARIDSASVNPEMVIAAYEVSKQEFLGGLSTRFAA